MGNKIYERDIVMASLKMLNSLPRCLCRKRPASTYFVGDPDITGCIDGRRIEIEIKRPGNKSKLTTLQEKRLREWAKVGAITGVARSADEVLAILAAHGALNNINN